MSREPDRRPESKTDASNVSPERRPELQDASLGDGFEDLLARVRNGDADAAGELAQSCRDYLLLIANQEMDRNIQQKLGPSDIVQNTMLAIHEHVDHFRGDKREQFLAWIRQILLNDLNRARHEFTGAAKRDVRREQSLTGDSRIGRPAIDPHDAHLTPQTHAVRNEEQRLVETAMQRLSEDYQHVILLRNSEHLSFSEIGKRLGRTEDAAQKLWKRAIERLKTELQEIQSSTDIRG